MSAEHGELCREGSIEHPEFDGRGGCRDVHELDACVVIGNAESVTRDRDASGLVTSGNVYEQARQGGRGGVEDLNALLIVSNVDDIPARSEAAALSESIVDENFCWRGRSGDIIHREAVGFFGRVKVSGNHQQIPDHSPTLYARHIDGQCRIGYVDGVDTGLAGSTIHDIAVKEAAVDDRRKRQPANDDRFLAVRAVDDLQAATTADGHAVVAYRKTVTRSQGLASHQGHVLTVPGTAYARRYSIRFRTRSCRCRNDESTQRYDNNQK